MSKTYTFGVRAEATVYRTLTITLPDGLTEDEVDERVNTAIDEYDFADDLAGELETTVYEPVKYVYAPVAPVPFSVPDDAWTEWRGARWACDGNTLVREGAPPIERDRPGGEWFSPRHRYGVLKPEQIDTMVAAIAAPANFDGFYHVRNTPLFKAAARIVEHGGYSPTELYDDKGELFAIVAAVSARDEEESFKRLSTLLAT